MSMSTNIVGVTPPDKKWKTMKEIWDKCEELEIELPNEVGEFFNYAEPDEKGVIVDLEKYLEEWNDEASQGYELKVKDIPKDVTVLRFYNSW